MGGSRTILYILAVILLANCQKNQSALAPPPAIPTLRDSLLNPNSSWEWLGRPQDDSLLITITIDPKDDQIWYVTSERGIYVTRDGGFTYQNYLSGIAGALELDPHDPSKVFVGVGNDLYASPDHGMNWTKLYSFPKGIASILVSKIDKAIYVGIRWEDSPNPNGIYKSVDFGKTWNFYSYGVQATGLIPWDIEEDSANKKIYVGTEIYTHPQPYYPPFLRSSDGGITWTDVRGIIPWHVVSIQIDPRGKDVYAFTEGAGIFSSRDFGDHWNFISSPSADGFIMDKNYPGRMFSGNPVIGTYNGGIYIYHDYQYQYEKLFGMEGHSTASLCLNGNSTFLYVASYNDGLYRAKLK
jgi:hypothetical protein